MGILDSKVYLPRGGYAARRTSPKTSSLAFIVLLDLGSSPTLLSTRLLIAPSNPGQPHQKNARMYLTPIAIISIKISVENKESKTYGAALADALSILTSFWWSWRESNPRPKHFGSASYSNSFYLTIFRF